MSPRSPAAFPFLFGRAFIEAQRKLMSCTCLTVMSLYFVGDFIEVARAAYVLKSRITFPFLFGRAFIEAVTVSEESGTHLNFSLPFRRDFH